MDSPKTPLRSEILIDVLGIIVLIAFFGSQLNLLRDPGVGWHLRTGEWIAHMRAVPHTDPFLFTSAGKSWICNQWLADLFFWVVYQIGGTPTLQVTALLLCVLPFLFFEASWLRRFAVSAPVLCLTLLLCMGLSLIQWYVRPVILSFFLFSLLYKILSDRCANSTWHSRDFILIPLLFFIWANLHPAFPLGLLLLIFAGADAVLRFGIRSRAVLSVSGILVLSILATLVNPFGLDLHRAIFGLVSSDYFMGLNVEWQSPNFHNPGFWPLAAVLAICVTAPRYASALNPFEKIAFGVFTVMGLTGARYVPFLGVAAAAPLACALQGYFGLLSRWRGFSPVTAFLDPAQRPRYIVGFPTALLGALLLVVTISTGAIPGWSSKALSVDEKFPAGTVEILKTAPQGSKVFHTPNWGGYFTWSVWPQQKAFIDDRNELNGKALYEDFFTVVRLRSGWKEVLERHGFNFMLLEKDTAVYSAIKSDSAWKLQFEDDKSALFKKQESTSLPAP